MCRASNVDAAPVYISKGVIIKRLFHTKRSRIAASLMSVALLASLGGFAAYSAFTSTVTGSNNSFSTGSLNLTTDDPVDTGFSTSDMVPGDTKSMCVTLDYTGDNPADVTLDATNDISSFDLGPYLDATVTSGTFAGPPAGDGSCVGFSPATSVGDVFTGADATTFDDLVTNGPIALNTSGGVTPWLNGNSNAYEITVTLPSDTTSAAEDDSADLELTWTATAVDGS
jgi:hypothetical protein